jgi:uncharacterized protein YndB with AHSA1/START domain
MADISTDHGSVIVSQILNVPVSRVYAAFADPRERVQWGAPSETAAFIYDATDFRVGGLDVARCGAKDDPRFRVETRYIDIVEERRVVWSETIFEADKTLAANLTAVEFLPEGRRTKLNVTVQVVSFVGPGMIENTKAGHEGSLASMARYLER